MSNHITLPSQNETFGFFGTVTNCPHRDRPSAEVWALAFALIADATHADSEDEMVGIREFLDSRMGRHFADDVIGNLTSCSINLESSITTAIAKWQDWRISRRTQREEGIPAGLPYLTGWVQHLAVAAAMEDAE